MQPTSTRWIIALALAAAPALAGSAAAQCCGGGGGKAPGGHNPNPPADQPAPPLAQPPSPSQSSATKFSGDPYPLDTCPVTGKQLGSMGEPVVKTYDGREVRFCCSACPKTFKADKATFWAKIDQQIIQDQLPRYPLDTCVVDGMKLDSMSAPVNFVFKNRLVRLCDESEQAVFLKDPATFVAKLDEAVINAQAGDYPLDTCLVDDMKLGSEGKPAAFVAAHRLIRLCAETERAEFNKDPAKYLAKLDEAWAAKPAKPDAVRPTAEDEHAGHAGHAGGG